MAVLDERREALAKSARPCKQIDNTEGGRQMSLLTNFIQPVYTRFQDKNQGTSVNGGAKTGHVAGQK